MADKVGGCVRVLRVHTHVVAQVTGVSAKHGDRWSLRPRCHGWRQRRGRRCARSRRWQWCGRRCSVSRGRDHPDEGRDAGEWQTGERSHGCCVSKRRAHRESQLRSRIERQGPRRRDPTGPATAPTSQRSMREPSSTTRSAGNPKWSMALFAFLHRKAKSPSLIRPIRPPLPARNVSRPT
jgi:hypothetical protein